MTHYICWASAVGIASIGNRNSVPEPQSAQTSASSPAEADCGSIKGAGVPAEEGTIHYPPGGEYATNLLIANVEPPSHDSRRQLFFERASVWGGHVQCLYEWQGNGRKVPYGRSIRPSFCGVILYYNSRHSTVGGTFEASTVHVSIENGVLYYATGLL